MRVKLNLVNGAIIHVLPEKITYFREALKEIGDSPEAISVASIDGQTFSVRDSVGEIEKMLKA